MSRKHRRQMVIPQEIQVELPEDDEPEAAEAVEPAKTDRPAQKRPNRAYPHWLQRTM